MRKNDKRKYLSPETEIVRFNVDDIITTSNTDPTSETFPDGDQYDNIMPTIEWKNKVWFYYLIQNK